MTAITLDFAYNVIDSIFGFSEGKATLKGRRAGIDKSLITHIYNKKERTVPQ